LQPVGSVAHVQVCGTTSCMICGAEDLVAVCRARIAPQPHGLSPDGRFSWEEVECLGACSNAPMVQIGKDYYEDLTAERLGHLLDELAAGRVPVPGPQNGRYAAEPLGGPTSLKDFAAGRARYNASVQAAVDLGDTIRRIDGTEAPLVTPWLDQPAGPGPDTPPAPDPRPAAGAPVDATGVTEQEAQARPIGRPEADPAADRAAHPAPDTPPDADGPEAGPARLPAAREGRPDDLGRIKGIGPAIVARLHDMGIFHFDQIAAWTPRDLAWVETRLEGFRGRALRDGWIEQAQRLARAQGDGTGDNG
jgi:NADH-quinone oxidoreductase subunit E